MTAEPPSEFSPETAGSDGSETASVEAELLPLVPEEHRSVALTIIRRAAATYSGPVPHAQEMARYKEVDPTFPERFLRMAERQMEHRHKLEERVVGDEFRLKRRGQDYALVSVFVLGAIATILAFLGSSVAAAAVAGTAIVGVVSIFVAGRLVERRGQDEEETTADEE